MLFIASTTRCFRTPPLGATLARSVLLYSSCPRSKRNMASKMPLASHEDANGASKKRSASTSPLKKPSKVARQDSFDDEDDLDDEALIAATEAAEEAVLGSSQASSAVGRALAGSSQTSLRTPTKGATSSQSATPTTTPFTIAAKKTTGSPSQQLRHGDDDVEKKTMDAEWYERLQGELTKPYFRQLKTFLQAESQAKKTIYPPAHLIHSWSRLTPLSTVKVVVVGQDPYHGPNQACGHSFSVPKGVAVPGSLLNIFKELTNEYGAIFKRPSHGCLDEWAKQGVLLLNACLTVQANQAGSHHKKGWEPFTQTILRAVAADAANGVRPSVKSSAIASMFNKAAAKTSSAEAKTDESTMKKPASSSSASKGVVFLAWGLPAAKTLAEAGITEKSPNILVLKSPHPSPLSAHRGFLGNGHFKKANEWLESEGRYGPGGGVEWTKL